MAEEVHEVRALLAVDGRQSSGPMFNHSDELSEVHQLDLAHLAVVEPNVFQAEVGPTDVDVIELTINKSW